jgi:hypothetical protein
LRSRLRRRRGLAVAVRAERGLRRFAAQSHDRLRWKALRRYWAVVSPLPSCRRYGTRRGPR